MIFLDGQEEEIGELGLEYNHHTSIYLNKNSIVEITETRAPKFFGYVMRMTKGHRDSSWKHNQQEGEEEKYEYQDCQEKRLSQDRRKFRKWSKGPTVDGLRTL